MLPGSLKRQVARAGARLVRERVAPEPRRPAIAEARRILPGGTPADEPGRYVPGEPMRLYGHRLNFDPTRDDEGVFLLPANASEAIQPAPVDDADAGASNATTSGERRVEQVIVNAPTQVLFTMPPDASGAYTVLIRRRHPRPDGPLLEGKLDAAINEA